MADIPEDVKRWTAKRRSALVLQLLRGETTTAQAARKYSLTVAEIEQWRQAFLSGAENALRSRPRDEEAQKDHEIKLLRAKVGELVMEKDVLTVALKSHPFAKRLLDK